LRLFPAIDSARAFTSSMASRTVRRQRRRVAPRRRRPQYPGVVCKNVKA